MRLYSYSLCLTPPLNSVIRTDFKYLKCNITNTNSCFTTVAFKNESKYFEKSFKTVECRNYSFKIYNIICISCTLKKSKKGFDFD